MTENVTGYGTRLAYGAATGASLPAYNLDSYTDIPDIENAKAPSPTREVITYKVLDQKAAKKIVGSIEYSSVSGGLVRAFDSTAQRQLRDDANAAVSVRRNWLFQHPDTGNETHYFAGYCSKFEYGDSSNDEVVRVSFEITVDGSITIVD